MLTRYAHILYKKWRKIIKRPLSSGKPDYHFIRHHVEWDSCYGWSGESAKIISENLKAAGFELVDDGINAMWNPDNENIVKCVEYGRQLAAKVHL